MSEHLKLENQICFKHYVISKEIIKRYRPFLTPLKLTYTGYITMLALWEHDGISMKKLSEHLYLDSGTLTPLLKKLESKGYLKRNRSKEDERIVTIHLTEKGKALKEKANDIPYNLTFSIFPEKVDEEKLKEHVAALNQVMEALVKLPEHK